MEVFGLDWFSSGRRCSIWWLTGVFADSGSNGYGSSCRVKQL